MKKIVIKLFLFFLGLIIIDQGLGYLFKRFIFSKTYSGEAGGNNNYLFKEGRKYDFIVLGSSRARNMINPALLTSLQGRGYNAGVNGVGGVLYMNSLVDLLINKKITPKYIVLQTDVNDYKIKRSASYSNQISSLYPYIDESKVLLSYSNALGFEEKLKLNLKLYRYNGKFYNVIINYFNKKSNKIKDGYTPLIGQMSQIVKKTNDFDNEKPTNEFDLIKVNALQNIFNVCENNGIRVFMVFPPMFNNSSYDETMFKRLLNYINNNYRADIINMADVSRFNDLQAPTNWKDGAHLNRIGSEKFSSYLNDSLSYRVQSANMPIK